MRYRRLDASGDMVFGGDQAAFLRDQPKAVAQAVSTRLGLYTGDWFLDQTDGMDWRAKVLGSHTLTTYDATIRARILGTQGVQTLTGYQSQRNGDTRNLLVVAMIDTIYGEARTAAALVPPL